MIRLNNGMLAQKERQALNWLVVRTPENIKPNDLTALGVAGAVITGIGFILCNISNYFILLPIIGLFFNWLGDSLDGSLARHRGIERPKYGYLIDHSCDLISNLAIIMGLGLSPYFTVFGAIVTLAMYYLFSSFTYIKVASMDVHRLAYGGMGATELRIGLILWPMLIMLIGQDKFNYIIQGYRVFDCFIGAAALITLTGFVWMVYKELKEHWTLDESAIVVSVEPPQSEIDSGTVIVLERSKRASA